MSRRFPTPLFGVDDDTNRRCRVFVSIAAAEPVDKSSFVARAQERLLKPEGGQYSEQYLNRIVSTYVQLGVLRQVDGGISVWSFANRWLDGDIDYETFLWYGIKQSWAIEGNFPEGIEGLQTLNRILLNADKPLSRGALRSRLEDDHDYEFNEQGIRGYPVLLCELGAARKTDDGYVAGDLAERFADRFRDADIFWQFERWLAREGPDVDPPDDRIKRELAKYYVYRESGGLGKHRQMFDTFREDFLDDGVLTNDPARPRMRRDEKYVAHERRRRELRQKVTSRFETVDGNDLSGLTASVLERLVNATDEEEVRAVLDGTGSGLSRDMLEQKSPEGRTHYRFPDKFTLYEWQEEAADEWFSDGGTPSHSGIASVVTGAGKTVMALEVIRRWLEENPDGVVTVLIPTNVLMRQWLDELIEKLNVPPRDVGWLGGGHKDDFADGRRVLVGIVNSVVKEDYLERSLSRVDNPPHLLVADECHRYTGDVFSSVFDYHRTAQLGLSATPLSSRDPDEWTPSDSLLVSELGDVYYDLTYDEAISRNLIPEFRVNYIGFDLTPAERGAYDRLSRKVSDAVNDIELRYQNRLYELDGNFAQKLRTIQNSTEGATPAIADYFRYTQERRDLIADAVARQAITLHLLQDTIENDKKAIVFQERIQQLERMVAPSEGRGRNVRTGRISGPETGRAELYEQYPQLKQVDKGLEELFLSSEYRPVMYHSGHRNPLWNDLAIDWFGDDGFANVMLSVKALVEGVDVPSADVGIVRVSSGSVRQRIQTLGRVLRTGESAGRSELHVLYARDTVDENIFYEHDWEEDLASAEVNHLEWVPGDSLLDGEFRKTEPPVGPPTPPPVPPIEGLELGDPYSGPRNGYQFSVDHEGSPFEKASNGRKFITTDSVQKVADFVHELKGGGAVTVNEAHHAIAYEDGNPIFAGVVDDLSSWEYEENDGGSSLVNDPDDYEDIFG